MAEKKVNSGLYDYRVHCDYCNNYVKNNLSMPTDCANVIHASHNVVLC